MTALNQRLTFGFVSKEILDCRHIGFERFDIGDHDPIFLMVQILDFGAMEWYVGCYNWNGKS